MGRRPDNKSCKLRAWAVAGLALGALVPLAGRASGGTINFTGAITTSSCSIKVNGSGLGDGTVALPTVDVTSLASGQAQRSTAAGTFFSIALADCAPERRIAVYFEAGPTVDAATHALINAGTSNVEVQLYEASAATVVGAPVAPGAASTVQTVAGSGTLYFYAGYSLAAGGAARAGTVSAAITYSLVYL